MASPGSHEQAASSVVRAVVLASLAIAILWALYLARHALLLVYISMLLAIGIGPVVHSIELRMTVPVWRWQPPRWLAILVVYVVIVGVMMLVGLLIIPPLVTQAQELWFQLPSLLDRAQTFLIERGIINERITLEEAVRRAPASPTSAVGTVALAVTRVVGSVFSLVTVLILTFYLLLESDSLLAGFARLFPRAERPRVAEASQKISTKISAWLNGQLMLAGSIGATAAAGLYLLGVPYFWVLALVAAIGEMIPVIGPMLSAIPATIVGFTVSPRTGAFVLLFWIAQQQLENHVLVPKVMERQVGVSAVTVIVALLVGGSLLGLLGVLLAVPTAAVVQVLIQELLDERDRLEARRGLES